MSAAASRRHLDASLDLFARKSPRSWRDLAEKSRRKLTTMIRQKKVEDVLGEKLLPSKFLAATTTEGVDLKRKATRKGKRLLMLPALLKLKLGGGELGVLNNFDGDSPTLTVTFPEGGRLRFIGRVLHPDQRFLHVAFEKKGEAACKDMFSSLIVFDECRWLGTPEENPEDAALELPVAVKEWRRQAAAAEKEEEADSGTYHYGCSSRANPAAETGGAGSAKRRAKPRITIDDRDDEDEDADNDDKSPSTQEERRTSGRSRKPISYAGQDDGSNYVELSASEDDDDDDDGNADNDSGGSEEREQDVIEVPPPKKAKQAVTKKRAAPQQKKKKPAPKRSRDEEMEDTSIKRSSSLPSRPRRSSASSSAYKEVDSDEDDDEEQESSEQDGDDEDDDYND